MAVEFPLQLWTFSNRLRVEGLTLHCPTPKSTAQTQGGDYLQARLGASLWQGECRLAFEQLQNTRGMRALIDLLLDENASFIFSPKDYFGPAADPLGTALGSAAVRIAGVAANNRDVTLAGLPSGYVLSGDDLMSWRYGANPVRFAFHRVVVTAAPASGGQATVEVWPRVQPGWTTSTDVVLIQPRFKAIMQSREAGGSARIFHSGMSFNYIQSLR